MRQYKHLFFDLDHTLWDFDANAREALTELYAHFELNRKVQAPFTEFYTKYLHHNQILWDSYHKGKITQDELKWKRMWRTLLDFRIGDEPLARELSSTFLEILPTKKILFPYTRQILDYLRDKKYGMHLITNGFENTQWSKLKHSGLTAYFTHVVTSEASNSIKPNAAIFEFAMQKAGASILDSIMIGDNPEADIQGAINAGMDSVFVNHVNLVTELKPTFTVYHLKELETIF
jgi:putative hydrolase of the HAD superfamily